MGRLLVLAMVIASCAGCVRPLRRGPPRVSTGWWQLGTQHVALTTDLPRETAEELAWAFEDTARALALVLPSCPAFDHESIAVVVFDDADAYAAITPSRSALAFYRPIRDGVSPVQPYIAMAHVHGQPQAFAHEVTHRWVDACAPTLPIWMNEGLAMTLETLRIRDDDIELGVPPFRFDSGGPVYGVRRDGSHVMQIARTSLPPAHELVTLSSADWLRSDDENARTAAYAAAWALVHLFVVGGDDATRRAFLAYLGDLRAFDRTPEEVLAQHLGGFDLDAALTAYTASIPSQRLAIPYTPRPITRPGARHLDPSEVHLLRGELLAYAHESAAAESELVQVTSTQELDAVLVRADLASGPDRARLVAQLVARSAGGDLRLTRARMAVALESGSHDDILAALPALERLQMPRARELVLLARAQLALHHLDEAMSLARRALQDDPSSFRARYVLAWALRELGRRDEAEPWLRSARGLATRFAPEAVPGLDAALEEIACHRAMSEVPELEASVPMGSISRQDVREVIRTQRDVIRSCYEAAIARGAQEGYADLRLMIGADGGVSAIDVCSTLHDETFDGCVRSAFEAAQFPAPGGVVQIVYPFVFSTEP